MGARGGAVGRGTGMHQWEGPGEGSQQLCPPLGSQIGGLALLPRACGMWFPSSTASVQPADPNHLLPAPAVVPVSHESLSMGGGGGQNPLPKPLPEQGLGMPLLSACSHSSLAAYL